MASKYSNREQSQHKSQIVTKYKYNTDPQYSHSKSTIVLDLNTEIKKKCWIWTDFFYIALEILVIAIDDGISFPEYSRRFNNFFNSGSRASKQELCNITSFAKLVKYLAKQW